MNNLAFDFIDHEFDHTVKLRIRLVSSAFGESRLSDEQIKDEITTEKKRKIEILEGLVESWNKGADMERWFDKMRDDQAMA